MASDLDPIYQAAAQEWNVDPALLRAVSSVETGGAANPNSAVSSKGAQGLMQIMPGTQTDLGVTDPNDPAQSIYGGAKYLSQMLDRYHTPEMALAAYNAGPDRVDKHLATGAPLPAETQAYVPSVTKRYQAITTPATGAPTSAAAPDDPFTAALKAASQPVAAPATADPFSAALTAAQKEVEAKKPPAAVQSAPDPLAGVSEFGYSDPAQAPPTPAVSPIVAPIENIANAAVQGYKDTSPILTPQAQQFVDQSGPIGRYITNPLLHIAGAVPAAANALGSGVAQAITEGAQAVGQAALGRDLNMLAQVTPFARVGTGLPLTAAAATEAPEAAVSPHQQALNSQADALAARRPGQLPAPNPLAASAPAFVPPGSNVPILQQIRQLIDADDKVAANKPAFIPPDATQPPNPLSLPKTVPPAFDNALAVPKSEPPTTGAPTPQSVGAAASSFQDTQMTPAQTQAYRSVAEGQKLNEPQPVGQDLNRYIPGVDPTMAQMEQSANISREQKMLESAIPEDFKTVAKEHNEARQDYFNTVAGSDVDVNNAVEARSAQAERDLDTAFGNKKPTNAQPVSDTIQGILTDPRDSENTAVQQYVRPLLDRLQNADGTLKNDPEQLYGIREDVARMQSKAAKAETPTLDHVNGQLQQIKDALDGVIEKGAPGYQQYLENYSTASRPIDAMRVLQQHENKLYDTQGRMQLSRVQGMMRNIVDSRAAPGINPYKSIPDETMAKLWALRDDLRRSASADELAKAKGSDTAQNLMDLAKGAGKMGLAGIAGSAANFVAPVAGPMILNKLAGVAGAINDVRAQRKMKARAANMLRPPADQYPTPSNPLAP